MITHVFEHIVLPNDTFSGLCLRYKTTSTKLRQYNNGFSGTSLSNAPAKLYIPVTNRNRSKVKLQNRKSKDFLEHLLLAEVPGLSCTNLAREYLNNHSWDVPLAIQQSKLDMAQKELQQIKAVEADAEAATKSKRTKQQQRLISQQQLQKNSPSYHNSHNNNNTNKTMNAFQDLFRSLLADEDGSRTGMQKSKEQQTRRYTSDMEMSPTNSRANSRANSRRPSLRSLSSSSTSSSSNSSPEEDYVVDMLTPPPSGHELRDRGMQQRVKDMKELECLLNCEQQKTATTTVPSILNVVKNSTTMIPTTASITIHNLKTKMSRNLPSLSARQAFYDNGSKLSEKINNRNNTTRIGGAAKLLQLQSFITTNKNKFPW